MKLAGLNWVRDLEISVFGKCHSRRICILLLQTAISKGQKAQICSGHGQLCQMLISHAVAYHPPKVRQMPPEDTNQKPKKKERRQYGHFENLLYKAGRNSSGWNPPASLSSLAPALNALQRRSMKPDIFELAPQEWLDGEPRAAHFFGDTFGSPGTRWVNRDGVGESSQTPGEWVEALAQLAGAIEAPAGVMNAGATPNGSLRLNPRHASLLEPDWVGLPAQLSSHFSVSGQFTQPHIVFGGGSLHRLVVMPGLNTDRPDESLDDCKPSSDLPPPAKRLRPAAQTSPNPALVSLWRWPSSVENTIAFIKWDNEPRDTNEDQVARLQRLFDSLTGPVDWVSLHRHDAFVLHSGSVCMSLTMHGRLTVATGYPLLAKREEETYEAADFTLGVLNGILQLHKDGGEWLSFTSLIIRDKRRC